MEEPNATEPATVQMIEYANEHRKYLQIWLNGVPRSSEGILIPNNYHVTGDTWNCPVRRCGHSNKSKRSLRSHFLVRI